MIRLRRFETDRVEEIPLEEFERLAREGRIRPRDHVCFPLLTGTNFVPARELEMFRGLRATDAFNFREYFTLGRVPWSTLALIALLLFVWIFWQRPTPTSAVLLVQQGAKAPSLMVELGQWWRLLSANLLHVSGWHLAVNLLFLFNIGGPAEAAYRRVDYIMVLIASALGTNVLSTLANPSVSCGASGIVFGVWGALAVFGIRYRQLLPERYQRYFIGNVIPYSIVT
ncbi:MAG: rhomboid family intramembrane serine protease, partial [Myxococcota bacterium]